MVSYPLSAINPADADQNNFKICFFAPQNNNNNFME
jgi:hypothetical protein